MPKAGGERRRARAPAGTYWRGSVLWGRVTVAGVEHRWSLRTGDAKLALARLEAERARLQAEAHFGERRITYEAAFAAWAEHARHHVAPSTAKRYAVSLGRLAPWLRGRTIDAIDRDLVATIVRERREAGVTTATIRRDLTALSSVLAFAEDEDWREGNPALERMRRLRERRDPIVLPDPADIARVIERAPGMLAAMIHAAALTGCRQEELAGAERRRLDFARRQLTIVGKRDKLRTIALSAQAFALLAGLPAALGSQALFWHGDGARYANVASRFAAIVDSVQISAQREGVPFRPFRFHDLRHYYAVSYLKSGGSLYDLQAILGHSSIKTTEIYLAHLTPEEARIAKQGSAQKSAHMQRSGTRETA